MFSVKSLAPPTLHMPSGPLPGAATKACASPAARADARADLDALLARSRQISRDDARAELASIMDRLGGEPLAQADRDWLVVEICTGNMGSRKMVALLAREAAFAHLAVEFDEDGELDPEEADAAVLNHLLRALPGTDEERAMRAAGYLVTFRGSDKITGDDFEALADMCRVHAEAMPPGLKLAHLIQALAICKPDYLRPDQLASVSKMMIRAAVLEPDFLRSCLEMDALASAVGGANASTDDVGQLMDTMAQLYRCYGGGRIYEEMLKNIIDGLSPENLPGILQDDHHAVVLDRLTGANSPFEADDLEFMLRTLWRDGGAGYTTRQLEARMDDLIARRAALGPARLRKAIAALVDSQRRAPIVLKVLLEHMMVRVGPRLSSDELRNIAIGFRWGLNINFMLETPRMQSRMRADEDLWCATALKDITPFLAGAHASGLSAAAALQAVADGLLIGDRRPSRDPDGGHLIYPLLAPDFEERQRNLKEDDKAPSLIKDVLPGLITRLHPAAPADGNSSTSSSTAMES